MKDTPGKKEGESWTKNIPKKKSKESLAERHERTVRTKDQGGRKKITKGKDYHQRHPKRYNY